MINTKLVRRAKKEDKEDFQRLWHLCFEDSEIFSRWIFEKRFYPEYSVCLEVGGKILSAMQALPYTVRARGKDLSGAMLCGVSTHPEHRGNGYMKDIFTFEMELLRQKEVLLAVHTPAVLSTYFSYGHLPVADGLYFEMEQIPFYPAEKEVCFLQRKDGEKIFPLYQKQIGEKYSGAINRTREEFLRKWDDYASDGGRCLIYQDTQIRGYAFFYLTENALSCVEAVAEDGYYHKLIEGLLSMGKGKRLSVKLPPALFLSFPFGELKRKQKGVAGAVNIGGILKALEIPCPYTIEVTDPIVKGNNGIFDFKGNKSKQPPALGISAGHLLQVLLGYVTVKDILPWVTVYDKEALEEMNAGLPLCNCYIIDEY